MVRFWYPMMLPQENSVTRLKSELINRKTIDGNNCGCSRRRFSTLLASLPGAALFLGAAGKSHGGPDQPGCSEWSQPDDKDFANITGNEKAVFLDRALQVIENEVVPKTMAGVRGGSKLFGAV